MPFDTVVAKTVEYLKIPSVVGFEKVFLDHLSKDFENLGLQVRKKPGLIEVRGRDPKSHIISAHADRHGLVSMGDGRFSYAAQYVRLKKYLEENRQSRMVLKAINERFIGEEVYAYDKTFGDVIGQGVIDRSELNERSGHAMFYINGYETEDSNIPVAYARNTEVNGNLVRGQIDNVVSLGIIYVLYQNGFQGTALLTTEEEIGKSWIHMKKWLKENKVHTKNLFILDTSPYREKDPIQNNMVVLRNRDKNGIFNPELTQKLIERCDYLFLPYQVKDDYFLKLGLTVENLGSTELGQLVKGTEGRWNGATIQIPTTEYHTSYETTSRGCIESYYRLLSDILIENPITEE
ncbi:MAG: hypothetical protein AAF549_09565 [Pseudomonadota bacterium]